MADQFKALTVINLPFIEERFAPGQMIPYERFVASAEEAAKILGNDGEEGQAISADDQIADLIKYGSLSEDPNAALHPNSIIPEPGRPTVAGLMETAKQLVKDLTDAGQPVPPGLRAIADAEANTLLATGDAGAGGETVGSGS